MKDKQKLFGIVLLVLIWYLEGQLCPAAACPGF